MKIRVVESIDKIDIMKLPTSERVDLILQFEDELDKIGRTGYNDEEYFSWLEDYGFDTSNYSMDTLEDDFDIADSGIDYEDVEEYEYEIETREDAARWLNKKLDEYGNTRWFSPADKTMLNKLIDKFGNTYFWNR